MPRCYVLLAQIFNLASWINPFESQSGWVFSSSLTPDPFLVRNAESLDSGLNFQGDSGEQSPIRGHRSYRLGKHLGQL